MKKGCLLLLGVLLGSWAAWAALTLRFSDTDGAEVAIVSGLGAIMTTSAVALVRRVFDLDEDEKALRKAMRGEPLEVGERGAASGEVRPCIGEEPLAAPFSGRPCVVYEYEVHRTVTTLAEERDSSGLSRRVPRKHEVRAFSGHGMVPCEVHTATGNVRLGTRPVLDAPRKDVTDPEARERARRFLATTAFEVLSAEAAVAAVREEVEDFTSGETRLRHDSRVADAPSDLDGWTLSEKVVSAGQRVTAIGEFSLAAGGLVGRGGDSWAPLKLWPEEAKSAGESIRSLRGCLLLVAGVLLVLQFLLAVRILTMPGR